MINRAGVHEGDKEERGGGGDAERTANTMPGKAADPSLSRSLSLFCASLPVCLVPET